MNNYNSILNDNELSSEDLKKHCNQIKNELRNCLKHNSNNLTVCQEPFLKKIFWASICEPLKVEKFNKNNKK